MAEAVIGYRLDLAVKLVDTTTGSPVSKKQVLFTIDGQAAALQERMSGVYVKAGKDSDARLKQDMELGVQASGYRAARIKIGSGILSMQYPTVEVPLIPKQKAYGYQNVVTLEGMLDGIEDIEAVSLHAPLAKVVSYNKKKQTMKLLYANALEEEHYALLSKCQNAYEVFRIRNKKDGLSLKLNSPLKADCHTEECITRIVKGCVDKNGRYLLAVRKDAFGTEYLVKYVVKGNVKFRRILFDDLKERRLE